MSQSGLKDFTIGLLVACGPVAPGIGGCKLPPGEAAMTQVKIVRSAPARALASALIIGALVGAPTIARADEGGVSFRVPGFFGSLAAAPLQPGFSAVNLLVAL